jgi:hypothetical protein
MNSSIAMPLSTTTRRSRWPLVLATMVLLALGAVLLAWGALSAVNPIPMNVTVDGERVLNGLDLAALPPAHKLLLAALMGFLMLAALVVVPMALLLSLACLLVAAVAIVGMPLLLAFAVLALVLSPLWLICWLIWKAMAG